MGILLDLIILAVIILFAVLSAKKGFVRTIIEIVGFVIVILIANNFSPIIAETTYSKAIEPTIVASLEKFKGEEETINFTDAALPDLIVKILGDDFDIKKFEDTITENFGSGFEKAVNIACNDLIKPVITELLTLIFSIIIILLLLIIVNIIAKLVNKLFSFSFAGTLNKTLGAVLGAFKGICIAAIICTLISMAVPLTENGLWIFTVENISSSFIFKLLSF